MREIVLDTETTGLDPLRGDRLVEIGCIEIYNRMPTRQTFHRYIHPERDNLAALLAAELLAEVYTDLSGARQRQLIRASETRAAQSGGYGDTPRRRGEVPLAPRIPDADRGAHRAFVPPLGDKPIWNDFLAA